MSLVCPHGVVLREGVDHPPLWRWIRWIRCYICIHLWARPNEQQEIGDADGYVDQWNFLPFEVD